MEMGKKKTLFKSGTYLKPGVHKFWQPGRLYSMLYGGAKYFWVLGMNHGSYHPPGAKNFFVAPKF
jgi:hypothetical protein